MSMEHARWCKECGCYHAVCVLLHAINFVLSLAVRLKYHNRVKHMWSDMIARAVTCANRQKFVLSCAC